LLPLTVNPVLALLSGLGGGGGSAVSCQPLQPDILCNRFHVVEVGTANPELPLSLNHNFEIQAEIGVNGAFG